MFNRVYRNAIRNRPRNFRKFGRSAWVKRAGMSRPRQFKTSRLAIGGGNNYITSKIYSGEGNLRKRKREFDGSDFGYKTAKLGATLGTVARGIYSYARRRVNKRYRGYDDPTDSKIDWLDIV